MQKFDRLLSLIQESPLSSNDVFVKPEKRLHPVVQTPSPIIELTSQDIRVSRGWKSSVQSTSEEPPRQSTLFIPKTLRRALSRSSSPLPPVMLKSSSKGKRQVEQDDESVRKEARASVMSGNAMGNYTGPKTIWTDSDSYLPRAKPPPPLKRIKHVRNRSVNDAPPPDPTVLDRQSTSHCESSGQTSVSQTASCPSRRSLDVPTPETSTGDNNQPATDQRTLTRTNTQTTLVSETSDDTDLTFVAPSGNWKPPTIWAGPSNAAPADEGDRLKTLGWFTRRKSAEDTSKGGSIQVAARINRVRSAKRMKPVQLADIREPEEDEATVTRSRPGSSGVMVKMQCYEGAGWHERPMADIIPKLRELKLK